MKNAPEKVKEAAEAIKAAGLGDGRYEEDFDISDHWYIDVTIAEEHGCTLSYYAGKVQEYNPNTFELGDGYAHDGKPYVYRGKSLKQVIKNVQDYQESN